MDRHIDQRIRGQSRALEEVQSFTLGVFRSVADAFNDIMESPEMEALKALKLENNQLREKNKQLENELAKTKEAAEKEIKAILKVKEREIDYLNAKLDQKVREHNTEMTLMRSAHYQANMGLADAVKELRKVQADYKEAVEDLEIWKLNAGSLKDEVGKMKMELNKAYNRLADQVLEQEQFYVHIRDFEAKVKEIKKWMEAVDASKAEVEKMKAEAEKNEAKVLALEDSVNEVEVQLARTEADKECFKMSFEYMRGQLINVKKNMDLTEESLNEKNVKIDELERQVVVLNQRAWNAEQSNMTMTFEQSIYQGWSADLSERSQNVEKAARTMIGVIRKYGAKYVTDKDRRKGTERWEEVKKAMGFMHGEPGYFDFETEVVAEDDEHESESDDSVTDSDSEYDFDD